MTRARFIDRDRGWQQIRKEMCRTTEGVNVAVGILADWAERREGEFDNVDVGTVHEFGSTDGRIPERSFIRKTIDTNTAKYAALAATLIRQVFGLTMKRGRALKILGTKIKADIQRRIVEGIPPPLSDETIEARERKGRPSTKPLVDTGQLKASIDFEVRG